MMRFIKIILFVFFILIFSQGSYASEEDAFYASSSVNIFHDNTSHAKAIGSVEIGAKIYVLKKKNGWYKIKIKGWQQKGLSSVIYAFNGKRIVKVELTSNGEKFLNIIKSIKDKDTGLIWKEVLLNNVWVNSKYFAKNMNEVWKSAFALFNERCSMCHALPKTTTFTANQWPATLKVMTRRAALNEKQADIVSKFLQYHAKGTVKLKE